MRKTELNKWEKENLFPAFYQILDNLGVSVDKIRSNSRERPLPDYRKIVCYRLSKDFYPRIRCSSIGFLINRDHSSVVVALREAYNLKECSKEFNDLLQQSYFKNAMENKDKSLNEILNDLVQSGSISEQGKILILKAAAKFDFGEIKQKSEPVSPYTTEIVPLNQDQTINL